MGTKSKSIKYSKGTRITAVVIVWLCLMSIFGSGFFLYINRENLSSTSYYDTSKFKDEYTRLIHNVVELNVKLKNEESIKASGEAQETISANLDRMYRIKNRLSNTVNFIYFIKNTQTGESITNAKAEDAAVFIKSQSNSLVFNQWAPDSGYPLHDDIKKMLSGTSYEVYTGVLEPLIEGDVFYDGFTSFANVKEFSQYAFIVFVSSAVLFLIAFIFLISVTGRREKGGEIVLSLVDRIYIDVFTALFFIAAVISYAFVRGAYYRNIVQLLALVSAILSADIFIGLTYILSMVRQIKNGQIIKNTLIYKVVSVFGAFLRLCFSGKFFKVWLLFLLLLYGAVNGILYTLMFEGGSSVFLISLSALVIFNIASLYYAAKSLLSLSQIMEAAKEISAGNLDYPLEDSRISISFSSFAGDIKSLQGGLKKAVAEAVKGERMKTDLITNVSHDLKTPLTSIINYVDLLKKEELDNQKASEYVGILEEKSARLKHLIEDLVEASKASSGNLATKAEKVDLNELVMQACGEFGDKIKKASLDIRIDSKDKKILVYADGKHMWRIVENLLSNVLKYSMPHSRVYINIYKEDNYGVMTIKNISAFPLNISPEQLTERFVRGDESRTTEGSGLGLSIAQSLTNIQGGRFGIDIDGDLFKVTVEVPLWLEK